MKSKRTLGLLMAAVLGVSALSGCGKKNETPQDENNTEATTSDTLQSQSNVYNTGSVEPVVEKSDLIADEQVYEEIKKINDAGYRYYNDNFKTSSFISNYSYLYSMTEDKVITVNDLIDGGYYTCPEGLEGMLETDIQLLMPKDVVKYGVEVLEADFACFYTSLRTTEGVFISSPEDEGGMMSYENYRNMIFEYIPEHGEIVYPIKNSEDYISIINAINEKNKKKKDYDVKHMVCDEKYAIAVVGDNDDITDIKEYILMKEEGIWKVSYDGLEGINDIITAINVHYPDLPVSMIPRYSIGANGEIRTDLDKFAESFVSEGIVNESDLPVTYACGAGQFMYMEFKTGVKVVGGANEKNELECYKVNNASEAVKVMSELSESAPIYIVKMNY